MDLVGDRGRGGLRQRRDTRALTGSSLEALFAVVGDRELDDAEDEDEKQGQDQRELDDCRAAFVVGVGAASEEGVEHRVSSSEGRTSRTRRGSERRTVTVRAEGGGNYPHRDRNGERSRSGRAGFHSCCTQSGL